MPKIYDLFSSKAIYHIIRKIVSKDRRINRLLLLQTGNRSGHKKI